MPQPNEPHDHPSHRPTSRTPHSSSRATSSRVPASQRVNVPNARDELERERELYSAHDPNQSALSPAQRYAQSQQNKANSNRQNYSAAAILRMLAAQTECPLPEKQAAHTTEHLLPAKQVPPMTELTFLADRAHALHIRGLILPIPAERPA